MDILQYITNDFMFIILGLMIFALGIWLYNLNNDAGNTLDLADLISEKGRISDGKLIRVATWIISSWGFVYLVLKDSLTEWFFLYYMGAWVANALISKHISRKANNDELALEISKGKTIRRPGDNFDPSDGE